MDPGVATSLILGVFKLEAVVHQDALRKPHLLICVHFVLAGLRHVAGEHAVLAHRPHRRVVVDLHVALSVDDHVVDVAATR